MTFASEELIEIGPFPQTSPLKGSMVIKFYEWTQAATDGGGTIATGIGTTPANGAVLAVITTGNVVDKDPSATFAVATGVITLDINATAGPTKGWLAALIRKS